MQIFLLERSAMPDMRKSAMKPAMAKCPGKAKGPIKSVSWSKTLPTKKSVMLSGEAKGAIKTLPPKKAAAAVPKDGIMLCGEAKDAIKTKSALKRVRVPKKVAAVVVVPGLGE